MQSAGAVLYRLRPVWLYNNFPPNLTNGIFSGGKNVIELEGIFDFPYKVYLKYFSF
jgi:hypothetical protein